MALISLHTLEETAKVASTLVKNLLDFGAVPIFMLGDMGTGKTTFTRFLVKNLPGAEQAETGSPSFNISNLYPTRPAVLHCDLYRCQNNIPYEIENAIFETDKIVIVEWANWLSDKNYPENYLVFLFGVENDTHFLNACPVGEKASKILGHTLHDLNNS